MIFFEKLPVFYAFSSSFCNFEVIFLHASKFLEFHKYGD